MQNDDFDKPSENKIRLLGIIFYFMAILVIVRSSYLAIGDERLKGRSEIQDKARIVEKPRRGSILDRHGEVLAMDVLVMSVGVHPQKITNKKEALSLISKYTEVDKNEVQKKLASKSSFVWIKRRIPFEKGKIIESKKLDGVVLEKEYKRFYPHRELAGHLLGAVGYDAVALGGLELSYDHWLKRESQLTQAQKDARGKFFHINPDPDLTHDIELTIDKNIQSITEKHLEEKLRNHQAKSAFAIVSKISTGETLAMANAPSFNPNAYFRYPMERWKNRALVDTFEPGSTFKTLLIASALNSGKVKANDRFNCEGGSLVIGGHEINDHGSYGLMTPSEILTVSSNVGVTKIAYKIGRKGFFEYLRLAGIGSGSGLELKQNARGFLRDYKTWMPIEFSNISFGQGLTTTGMEMIRAYGGLLNDGLMMKPYIVKRIVTSDFLTRKEVLPTPQGRILSKENSEEVKKMLHNVTQPGGTALSAHVPAYHAGGKTGTAQKVDPKIKTYAKGEYVSSFIGFTPFDKPEYLIYVVFDTPRANGYYGGVVAAPVFKNIATDLLAYSAIAPQGQLLAESKKNRTKETETPNASTTSDFTKIAANQPKRSDKIKQALKQAESGLMPDLTGFGLRDIMRVRGVTKAGLEVKGRGYVRDQYPKPLSPAGKNWKIILDQNS